MARRRPDLVELLRFVRGELSDPDARRLALEVMDDPTLVDWVRWLSQVDDASAALAFEQVPAPVTSALHALFAEHDLTEVDLVLAGDSRRELAGARSTRLDGSYTVVFRGPNELIVCDVFVEAGVRWLQVEVADDGGAALALVAGWLESDDETVEGTVVNGRLEFDRAPAGPVVLHARHARGRVRAVLEEGW